MRTRGLWQPVTVSLRRLFPSASFVGCGDIRVREATDVSGSCGPGSLFAAVRGTRHEQCTAESMESVVCRLAPGGTLMDGTMRTILFVCTGNTCRSPLAEGLTKVMIADRLGIRSDAISDYGFDVSSAGIYAYGGGPISHHSFEELKLRGIDLGDHRATTANERILERADKIYCLSHSHLAGVLDLLPPERAHTAALLDIHGAPVPDPIGGSASDYRRCADHIAGLLNDRLGEWA